MLDPIETWKLATKGSTDWITWDLDDIRMRPIGRNNRRILANVIYSGGDVLDVFVGGEALRRNGKTITIDESDACREIEEAVLDYYSVV